jgi:hypothetical protein
MNLLTVTSDLQVAVFGARAHRDSQLFRDSKGTRNHLRPRPKSREKASCDDGNLSAQLIEGHPLLVGYQLAGHALLRTCDRKCMHSWRL